MIIDYIHYLFVFILVWWVVFFIILPFGVHVPHKQEDSKWASSAPSNPKIMIKLLITTTLSVAITTGYYVAMCTL